MVQLSGGGQREVACSLLWLANIQIHSRDEEKHEDVPGFSFNKLSQKKNFYEKSNNPQAHQKNDDLLVWVYLHRCVSCVRCVPTHPAPKRSNILSPKISRASSCCGLTALMNSACSSGVRSTISQPWSSMAFLASSASTSERFR